MATLTTLQLVQYYSSLLIMQYLNKPNATAMIQTLVTPVVMPQTSIQTIAFSDVAASGVFQLSYNGNHTTGINWNDSVSTIQTKISALSGLGSITVSGSIASQLLTVTFTGVTPPALSLGVFSNTLINGSSKAITLTLVETDETLPLAIQDGFNLSGSNIAQGAQLDVIGKYVGVTRSGSTSNQNITLNDTDFLTLIRFGIIRNSLGSSLSIIVGFLFQFFPNQIFVFDYQNMTMSYVVDTSVGSLNLLLLVIAEGLLPAPLGVQIASVIFVPNAKNLFGFGTYEIPAYNNSPFNTYSNYQTDWPWLSYTNSVLSL